MKIDDEIDEQTKLAITTYTGPMTRCRPGKARGDKPIDRKPKPDVIASWLVPPPDEKEQRRQQRMARAKKQRIVERNTTIMRRSRPKTTSPSIRAI